MKSIQFLTLLFIVACLFACKTEDGMQQVELDEAAFLDNYANAIIVPNFIDLQEQLQLLESSATTLVESPTNEQLEECRNAFKAAYIAYQYCYPYLIGPSADIDFNSLANIFPADAIQIDLILEAADLAAIDFDIALYKDTRGFPAIDYFLYRNYGHADSSSVVDEMINQSFQGEYLLFLIHDLKTTVDQIVSNWDSYKNDFLSNEAYDVGSPISILTNNLNQQYEFIINYKLEIPLGIGLFTETGFPDKLEGYYSGFSAELTAASIEAMEQMYLGKSKAGIDGIGFDDFMRSITATNQLSPIDGDIQSNFSAVNQLLSDLNEPFINLLMEDPTPMVAIYDQLRSGIARLKTDLPSRLGVSITYVEGGNDTD